MKRFVSTLVFTGMVQASVVFYAFAQEANAPTYHDGEWWKARVEVSYRARLSRSAGCHENYPEYMVKIDQGKPKIYGLKENSQEGIQCPIIAKQLLGFGEEGGEGVQAEYLKFPLNVGKKWSSRIPENIMGRAGGTVFKTRWSEVEYNVVTWEKVPTAKKELEAFKITVSGWRNGPSPTYFYSPQAKAIVRFRWDELATKRTMELVDYNVGQ